MSNKVLTKKNFNNTKLLNIYLLIIKMALLGLDIPTWFLNPCLLARAASSPLAIIPWDFLMNDAPAKPNNSLSSKVFVRQGKNPFPKHWIFHAIFPLNQLHVPWLKGDAMTLNPIRGLQSRIRKPQKTNLHGLLMLS